MFSRIMGALNRRRAELRDREGGFTLVELLVVVIIIGILAAIAIPVFIGIQNNAKDSAAQSDLANAKVAVTAYYAADPAAAKPTEVTLKPFGFTKSDGVKSIDLSKITSSSSFCIEATSAADTVFSVKDSGSVKKEACS